MPEMHKIIFVTKNKGEVEIHIDDDYQVTVWTVDGLRIGHMYSSRIEGDPRHGLDDVVKLTNMYLDGPDGSGDFRFQGIGRRCIRLLSEQSGCLVVVAYPDGQVHDDGSHPTGDAPTFVKRMESEGLVRWANAHRE